MIAFIIIQQISNFKAIAKYEPRISNISPTPGTKNKKINPNKAKGRIDDINNAFKEELDTIIALAKKEGISAGALAKFERSAKKNIWSKGHLPIAYTVLNPQLVTVDGSLVFDKKTIKLTVPTELSDVLKKKNDELSEEEKEFIKALPAELKKAAESGGDIILDSRLVSYIT